MKKVSLLFMSIAAIVLTVASFFVFSGGYRKYDQNNAIEREIEKKKQEADRMTNDNKLLSEQVAYLKTPEFREQQAKEKLNLKKPGESVAIIKPVPGHEGEETPFEQNKPDAPVENVPNWKKWWEYLFLSR